MVQNQANLFKDPSLFGLGELMIRVKVLGAILLLV
jgi:hypothetical protein